MQKSQDISFNDYEQQSALLIHLKTSKHTEHDGQKAIIIFSLMNSVGRVMSA